MEDSPGLLTRYKYHGTKAPRVLPTTRSTEILSIGTRQEHVLCTVPVYQNPESVTPKIKQINKTHP
jgi:hypothetical protein